MLLRLLLAILICGAALPRKVSGQGTTSPALRCITVASGGIVTLSWLAPADTCSLFSEYYIYRSPSAAGPFARIDSIASFTVTAYTDLASNANAAPLFYFVEAASGCGLLRSDTLQSMHLSVVNSGGGIAGLAWNAIRTPLPGGAYPYYRVYREYPPGTWTLTDSASALTYFDTITICSAYIAYRIELSDSSGCVSVSSVDGDAFQDLTGPDIPEIDTVSVDSATGNAVVAWTRSKAKDTGGYIVYRFVGGFWQPVDTLWSRDSTLFINTGGGAGGSKEEYRVAAFDTCFNLSPLGVKHNTVFVAAWADRCALQVTLNWNDYIGWTQGVSQYIIYAEENGGPAAVAGSTAPGLTSFVHSGLNPGSTYCYIIRAVDGSASRTSSSNKVCVAVIPPVQPAFAYLKKVTVNGAAVEVTAWVDTSADILSYRVLRAPAPAGPWSVLATLPAGPSPLVSYTDVAADPAAAVYHYKVEIIDSCGAGALVTPNDGRNILCTATANADFTNDISWSSYGTWLGNVAFYNLYRSVDGLLNPVPVATLPSGVSTYRDDVAGLASGKGEFCYFVEAAEGPGNPYLFSDTSRSNSACAHQFPKLYLPTAFTPDGNGLNDVFTPISVFIDPLEYSFIVFNRWSDVVFETANPNVGWDGTFNGRNQPLGVYVYFVRIKTADGRDISKKGTFSLVR